MAPLLVARSPFYCSSFGLALAAGCPRLVGSRPSCEALHHRLLVPRQVVVRAATPARAPLRRLVLLPVAPRPQSRRSRAAQHPNPKRRARSLRSRVERTCREGLARSSAPAAAMASKTALDGEEKDAVDIRDEKVLASARSALLRRGIRSLRARNRRTKRRGAAFAPCWQRGAERDAARMLAALRASACAIAPRASARQLRGLRASIAADAPSPHARGPSRAHALRSTSPCWDTNRS